ncbi:MAG: LysM peptidoglycan-binding domain-containing protein [Treponema sp.]|nr:LysM peptidoglycan-binding domain-containing protein [Treponema sp.]
MSQILASSGEPAGTAQAPASPGEADDTAGTPSSRKTPRPHQNLLDNEYYRESLRLTRLAQETYDYGDYDLARQYAEEAQKQARLSDEYIALQLKIAETDDAIEAAGRRIEWALSVKADKRYPGEFSAAAASRDNAVAYRDAENWDAAISAALEALEALALVEDIPGILLPSQYQVRSWAVSQDCFWNIASRTWAYGDSQLWQRLYEANRKKLTDPANPNIIQPGIILDIPSINGEEREGLWNADTDYPSFKAN